MKTGLKSLNDNAGSYVVRKDDGRKFNVFYSGDTAIAYNKKARRFQYYNKENNELRGFAKSSDAHALIASIPEFNVSGLNIRFDSHLKRYREYNSKSGKMGKFVSNKLGEYAAQYSARENPLVGNFVNTNTIYNNILPETVKPKIKSDADRGFYPTQSMEVMPVPPEQLENLRPGSRTNLTERLGHKSLGSRLKKYVLNETSQVLPRFVLLLGGVAAAGLLLYEQHKLSYANGRADQAVQDLQLVNDSLSKIAKKLEITDLSIKSSKESISVQQAQTVQPLQSALALQPNQPAQTMNPTNNVSSYSPATSPTKGPSKTLPAVLETKHVKTNFSTKSNYAYDNARGMLVSKEREKEMRAIRDGKLDANKNLEERTNTFNKERKEQVKRKEANPWTPIAAYVDQAVAHDPKTPRASAKAAWGNLVDVRNDIFGFGLASYTDEYEEETENDFHFSWSLGKLKSDIKDEMNRVKGYGIPSDEDPFSIGLGWVTRSLYNKPIEIGLDLADLTTLTKNFTTPAMELRPDTIYAVRDTLEILPDLAKVPKLPPGIKQLVDDISNGAKGAAHFSARVAAGQGQLGMERMAYSAERAGSRAGRNLEDLTGFFQDGIIIYNLTEEPVHKNHVTGGRTGGPTGDGGISGGTTPGPVGSSP